MVQFLKAKQTTFVNKPVGVVGVDMGGQQAGRVLANVADNMAKIGFARATADQEKYGKEYARNMEIDIRDDNGDLQFKQIDSTLSDIAKASAEPIVRQRYGEALRVDINNAILDIRRNSKSAEDFKNTVETRMGEYITSVKNLGGGDYQGVITQDIAKISSQYFNDMSSEEFKEALVIAAQNRQSIISQTKNDYITSISQSVTSNANIDGNAGIADVTEELNVSRFIIDKLQQDNNDNLKVNNQNPAITGAENRKLNQATSVGLMRGLISGKNGQFIRAVRQSLLSNQDTVDENGKQLLTKYEQDVLNLIKDQNQDDAALAELTGSLTITSNDESVSREIKGFKIKERNQYEKTIEKKDGSYDLKINDQEKSFTIGSNIGTDIVTTGNVSEQNINNIIKETENIKSRRRFKTQVVEGETVGYELSDNEVTAQVTKFVHNISQKITRGSGLFVTSSAKENLSNYLQNENTAGLSSEQIKVADQIKKVMESAGGPTQFFKKTYQKVLIEDAISESRVEVNQKDQREIDIVVFEATNGIGKHSNKRSLQLDKGFDVDLNYFGQGTFQKNLMAEDGTAEKDKANVIDQSMNNGQFPNAFVQILNNATSGNANSMLVETALNYFNKYTRIRKSGGTVDRLIDVLDKKTYNLLSMANTLQIFKGVNNFGISTPEGQGVTSGQLMQKLIQVRQDMDQNGNVFKANLSNITDGDATINNSFKLLMETYDFDVREAQDLSPIMDMFISMGINKDTITTHFDNIKQSLYVDGEGTILDRYSGSKVLSRSKFGLIRTIPDDNHRSSFRQYLTNKLSEIPVPRDATDLETKFYLNYAPDANTVEYQKLIRSTQGRKILQERRNLQKDGTAVYLQPLPYGPDMTRVRYNAMYLDKTGNYQAVLKDGIPVTFDLDEIMAVINPDYDDEL